MKKNCIVAQSGGPTAAINASLSGVIKAVLDCSEYETIYGSVNGIQGVINENFINLSIQVEQIENFIDRLKRTPAMYLGSCRFKLPDQEKNIDIYEKIFDIFVKMNIGAFFYIGGNDSMDTVDKLSAYARSINSPIIIAGIPKTIDNDLVITDHTPGYGSACKYLASTIREIAYDTFIYPIPSVTIVEVMGRDSGWLTAASALARNEVICAPHLIYLPEVAFDTDKFIEDINRLIPIHRNIIVAVSEGIKDKNGNYLSASDANQDIFGHSKLSGTGKLLEALVQERIGVKVRSIELNVMQRCSGHIISKTDIEESLQLGYKAVEFSLTGESGYMTTIKRTGNKPYTYDIDRIPVHEVANLIKDVPIDWITKDGNDVTQEMIDYVFPLIQGELINDFKEGVIDYVSISHLKPL